jgi:hypothetical protein
MPLECDSRYLGSESSRTKNAGSSASILVLNVE